MGSKVVAFPLHRRRELIAGIAEALGEKNGEAANLFWRHTAKGLLQQLLEAGVAMKEAEDQVRSLLHVVLHELHHASHQRQGA